MRPCSENSRAAGTEKSTAPNVTPQPAPVQLRKSELVPGAPFDQPTLVEPEVASTPIVLGTPVPPSPRLMVKSLTNLHAIESATRNNTPRQHPRQQKSVGTRHHGPTNPCSDAQTYEIELHRAHARGGLRRSWNQTRYLLIFSRCAAGA